ncbi:MAG: hypothetical protein LBV42_05265 [Methanobrevibacter sp.]|jgi:hypothetical protein|nr:hypothetical protein [Methanobrevibacter sp.]
MNINGINKIFNEKILNKVIWLVSFILFFAFLIASKGNHFLRYDEIFSLTLVKDNLTNIITLTGLDVIPPLLHYLWLKLVIGVCEFLHVFGGEIFRGSISSAIPILILMIFSITTLRKEIGNFFASLFCFTLVTIPHMIYYILDVRMYKFGNVYLFGK